MSIFLGWYIEEIIPHTYLQEHASTDNIKDKTKNCYKVYLGPDESIA